MQEIVVQVLLFVGVGVCVLSAAGLLLMDGTYDKLHYLSPMSTLGAAAIGAAVVLDQGASWGALKVVVLVLLLAVSSAVLTQATARALQYRAKRGHRAEGEGE